MKNQIGLKIATRITFAAMGTGMWVINKIADAPEYFRYVCRPRKLPNKVLR